jgi:hypothetical protein
MLASILTALFGIYLFSQNAEYDDSGPQNLHEVIRELRLLCKGYKYVDWEGGGAKEL